MSISKNEIQMLKRKGAFEFLEDGFWYFWPTRGMGAFTAQNLRDIAEHLDERNKEWEAQIERELGGKETEPIT